MNGVNPDLLRAVSSHHPDGRPKDRYAHHRAEHLHQLRLARRERWLARLDRLRQALARPIATPRCPPARVDQPKTSSLLFSQLLHGGPGV